MKYTFNHIYNCNMCGSVTDHHILLGQRLNKSQGFSQENKVGITVSVMRCIECGLIYNQPMPIPANIRDHYDMEITEYWENPAILYSKNYFCNQFKMFEQLCGSPPKKNMKALDVGSGLGQTVVALTKAGFEAIGIEPSYSFYESSILYSKLPREKFINNSFENIKLNDNEYDLITCANIIEHLYNPSVSLLKCVKALKPRGLLCICVPSSNWLKATIVNVYYKLIGSGYVTNTSPMHPPFHLYEFTEKTFLQHSKKNKYKVEIISIKPDSIVNIPLLKNCFGFYTKQFGKGLQMDIWIRKNY